MNPAVALAPGPQTKWTFINGELSGTIQTLMQPKISLGRSAECDIVIPDDPKCSRKHAVVVWTPQGYEIHTASEKNPVRVNGEPVDRAILADNAVITLGQTELQFNMTVMAQPMMPQPYGQHPAGPSPMAPYQASGAPQPGAAPMPTPPRAASKKSTKKWIIYGVVGLLLFWLFTPTNGKKKKDVSIRTEQEIKSDIEAAKKMEAAAEKIRTSRVNRSIASQQAQINYVKGFRDYQDGQYGRSLESFQACLALNPDHVLCNRYIRLAHKKYNELIETHMVLGRKYRDQSQYRACRSEFRNVMVMVKDPNNQLYKEARANFEACNAFVEGTY